MLNWVFNPFTDELDAVNAPADQYLDGEVEFHGDLPVGLGIPAINSAFLVRKGSGLYFLSRKPAGIWVRELNNGNLDDWKYAGNFSDLYRDSNFRIISDTDTSREIAFSAASISSGQTRTITVPDKNVTLDDAADARTPTAHKTTHAIGGTDALTPSDIKASPSDFRVLSTTATAVIGDRIAADTSAGAFTITLPASPANGDTVEIADHAATFGTNALTLGRNGNLIESLAEDLVANVNRALFTLVWVGGSVGWRIVAQSATANDDASLLTTGTLADARLSSNVPLKDAANTFSANQTLDGTNNVAPNQTAASDSSLMTRALVDRRIVSPSIIHFREDFLQSSATGGYGETRWDGGTSGGSLAYQNAANTSGRAGAWLMTTGSGSWARLRKTGQSVFGAFGNAFEYVAICKLEQTSNINFGFGGNTSTTTIQNFPAFVYNDAVSANWFFHTVDTGYVATTNWVYLRAWRHATSGNINYEIRADEFGTLHASGNVSDAIPNQNADFGFTINAPAGQTAAAMVDYAALWMTAPTR